METVIASLGDLIVRALPTFFLILILHFYMKATFFGPLEAALKDRQAATSGTKKAAEESLARAEAKAAEYEAKLRDARGVIYKEQEAIRAQLRDQQNEAVAAVKSKCDGMLKDARATVQSELEAAKAGLASQSNALAAQIAQTILSGRSN
ncbi:MAG: ATP synthase F0 subunit B [Acidobacteria bacterium]|nr:ATP synthase F0 subunit B [Acidobacteriota bacterium]